MPTAAPMMKIVFSQFRITLMFIQQRLEFVKQEVFAIYRLTSELAGKRKKLGVFLVDSLLVRNPFLGSKSLWLTFFVIEVADVADLYVYPTVLADCLQRVGKTGTI